MAMDAQKIIEKVGKLRSDRGTFEHLWQEVTDYMVPNKAHITIDTHPGEKKFHDLYDSTAVNSVQLLANTLQSLLIPESDIWFAFTTGNRELDRNIQVRSYFQKVRVALFGMINDSNFQTEAHEAFIDIASIGTAAMAIEETDDDDEQTVRFSTKHISEYFIDEDSKGRVRTIYRKFKLKGSGIIEMFGSDNIPPKLKEQVSKDSESEFEIIQAIYPKVQDKSKDQPTQPFRSQFVSVDTEEEIIEESFNEFPFVVPRWMKASNEMYGRSQGMSALPDTKTVNEMVKVTIKGAQKTVDPPLQIPDDGFVLPLDQRPAGINYYRAGTPREDRIQPIFNDSRVDFGFQTVSEKQQRIRDAFFVDQIRLPQRGDTPPTATEVNQRVEEAFRLLSPMIGRLEKEFLNPMIDRLFGIAERAGILPEVPQILQEQLPNGRFHAQYTSVVNLQQRAREGTNIAQGLQLLDPVFAIDPQAADLIDADGMTKRVSEIYDWNSEFIRSEREVAQIRQRRAQAQRQAQQAEDAERTVDASQKLGQTEKALSEARDRSA